jgi:tetratricopeptide (TPR) repeat protein
MSSLILDKRLPFCLLVFLTCTAVWSLARAADSPPLTAKQKEQLKERDRLIAEMRKRNDEGRVAAAIETRKKALAIERQVFGDVHPDVANSLKWLMTLSLAQEDFAAARQAARKALAAYVGLHGAKHWIVTDARLDLAYVDELARLKPEQRQQLRLADRLVRQSEELGDQGKYDEALPLAEQALQIRKKLLGNEHWITSTSLIDLGWLYREKGDNARAETLYQQALTLRKRVLGEDHPWYGAALNNLGWLHTYRGEYERAEKLFRQAATIHRRAEGEGSSNYKTSLNNLIQLYTRMARKYEKAEDFAAARRVAGQELAIRIKLDGEAHWRVTTARLALVRLERLSALSPEQRRRLAEADRLKQKQGQLYAQYQYREALPLAQEALEAYRQLLGEDSVQVEEALNALGLLYKTQGAYERGEAFYRQALAVAKKVYGETHPTYARRLMNLGYLCSARGDHQQAEANFLQAAKVLKKTYGAKHATTVQSLTALADCYGAQALQYQQKADFAVARKNWRHKLDLLSELRGADSWQATDARLALADVDRLETFSPEQRRRLADADRLQTRAHRFREEGKFEEALTDCQKALAVRKELLGEKHRLTADSLNLLGVLYEQIGDLERADPVQRRSLEIRKQILGENHPDYALSLNNIGFICLSMGDFARAEPHFQRAFEISKRLRGPADSATVLYLTNLIDLHQRLARKQEEKEDYPSAAKTWRTLIALKTQYRGAAHWEVTDARLEAARLERLGQLDRDQRGRYAEVKRLHQRMEQLTSRGKYREALVPCQEALPIWKELLGEKDRLYANGLSWLGYLRVSLKDEVQAEAPYRQAVGIYQEVLGDTHPAAVHILKNVVGLYERLGAAYETKHEFGAARKTYQSLVELRTRLYGAAHWQVINARLALDMIERKAHFSPEQHRRLEEGTQLHLKMLALVRQEKYREALGPCRQALEIRKELLGVKNTFTLASLASLGWLCYKTGDNEQARTLLLEAVEVGKQIGEAHPASISSLYSLIEFYQATGDYDKAEAVFRRTITLTRQLGSDAEADYDLSFNSLIALCESQAAKHEKQQDWSAARRVRDKIVVLLTYRHGPRNWRVTNARLDLAYLDRLARMKPEQRRRLGEADALAQKEGELYSQGKYREALPLAQQALAIYQEVLGEENARCATWLHNVGYLSQSIRDQVAAEANYQKALAVRKKVLGENHPNYASTLRILGKLYYNRGEYVKAEPLHQQALNIRRRVLGQTHADTATSLNELALVYMEMGRYDQAETLLQEAIAIQEKARDELYSCYLVNLALLYLRMRDYVRAEPLCREAVEVCRKNPQISRYEYAFALEGLASLHNSVGELTKAEPLYKEVLEVRKKLYGEDDPLYATSLVNLADLYLSQWDHRRAEPLVSKALEIRKKIYGEAHSVYVVTLSRLAWIHRQRREWDQAEALYRKNLEITRKVWGETDPEYALALYNMAILYDDRGDPARAASLHRQCLDVTRRNWQLAADSNSQRQQLSMVQSLRRRLDEYLSASFRAHYAAEEVYPYVLSWKGAVFDWQRWRREQQHILQERSPEVARLYDDLQRTTTRLAALAFTEPEKQKQADRQRELQDLTNHKEKVERELARRSAFFRKRKDEDRPTVRQLQESLPNGTVLIDLLEYTNYFPLKGEEGSWSSERHLTAFVVRRDALARVELGPVKDMKETLDRWRLALQRQFRTEADIQLGVEVRKLIWKPLEKHLSGARVVLVSPDGLLTRVPLAALPGEKPERYLIEDLALAVVPVPHLLPELLAARPAAPKDRRETSLLLLGDVDFGPVPAPDEARVASRSGARVALPAFSPLEATRVEILAVRDTFEQRFPDGRVWALRGDRATSEAFRSRAPKAQWLHLATHGFFAPPEVRSALAPPPATGEAVSRTSDLFRRQGVAGYHPGLLSGLVLAGANRPAETGEDNAILTALEVESLDLRGVELATLSACETGLGEEAGGEGLLGLQRAFQLAGARSVVASLWRVDDKATRDLMTHFYENLWKKKLPRLEALRQAQLLMLKEGLSRGMIDVKVPRERLVKEDGRLPPYYWAAFALSGDWR